MLHNDHSQAPEQQRMLPGTATVWGGERDARWHGATQVPIVHSVAFSYSSMEEWIKVATGEQLGYVYSRGRNPTVHAFEEKVRLLEGGQAAVSGSTGMGIISSSLFSLLRPGDRVVSLRDTYGGTHKIFTDYLPQFGVDVHLCDTDDDAEIEREIRRGCKLFYLESPTNPTLKILDIRRFAAVARSVGALTVMDNTFATPFNQNPLAFGVDLVLHSATKFLCGHADALGGVACGSKEVIDKLAEFRMINGSTLDPMSAYFILRGMKTLGLRIERQNHNALSVARHLSRHPRIKRVYYPGLESHPNHDIARQQMRGGFGGIVSFELQGDSFDAVLDFLPRLKLAHPAGNLGAVETIVGPPATTSHIELTKEERAALGIPENLIRYSCGIECAEDLIADLDQALSGSAPRG